MLLGVILRAKNQKCLVRKRCLKSQSVRSPANHQDAHLFSWVLNLAILSQMKFRKFGSCSPRIWPDLWSLDAAFASRIVLQGLRKVRTINLFFKSEFHWNWSKYWMRSLWYRDDQAIIKRITKWWFRKDESLFLIECEEVMKTAVLEGKLN